MGMVYAEEIEGAVLGACLLERSAQAVIVERTAAVCADIEVQEKYSSNH